VRGNPHAAFDEAGAGNVAGSRYCDTRMTERASNREYKLRSTPARQSPTLPKTVMQRPIRSRSWERLTYQGKRAANAT
jgi:hypothetical protein